MIKNCDTCAFMGMDEDDWPCNRCADCARSERAESLETEIEHLRYMEKDVMRQYLDTQTQDTQTQDAHKAEVIKWQQWCRRMNGCTAIGSDSGLSIGRQEKLDGASLASCDDFRINSDIEIHGLTIAEIPSNRPEIRWFRLIFRGSQHFSTQGNIAAAVCVSSDTRRDL